MQSSLLQILRLLFLAFALSCFTAAASEPKTLSFGVVPQQSAKVLAANWGPLLAKLSEDTGLDIRFATASNIPIFEKRLAQSTYDIAYMNPYHYAVFSQQAGYRAIAKQQDKYIRGIIVVKHDSPITHIAQLHEKKMAFPAPLAFAATLIPQAVLAAESIAVEPQYVQSHDSVYLAVSRGFFPAGGGIVRTLNNAPVQVRDDLRILWTSESYTPHAIAVSKHMPTETAEAITQALLNINDSELLKAIGFTQFGQAKDSDWDSIRALNINVSP